VNDPLGVAIPNSLQDSSRNIRRLFFLKDSLRCDFCFQVWSTDKPKNLIILQNITLQLSSKIIHL
jgi:hypothetical protein